jgi:hypothetical protein
LPRSLVCLVLTIIITTDTIATNTANIIIINIIAIIEGRGSVDVEVLGYKQGGRWFESR